MVRVPSSPSVHLHKMHPLQLAIYTSHGTLLPVARTACDLPSSTQSGESCLPAPLCCRSSVTADLATITDHPVSEAAVRTASTMTAFPKACSLSLGTYTAQASHTERTP